MELESSSFFELASQRFDDAYIKEAKAILRKRDSQQNHLDNGPPAVKRARLSQDSGIGYSQATENSVPLAADGTIKTITLIDFMCHAHLKVDFNPKVNFLIGQNGSGKSAILTAITVGLGANARETGRGKTLKDLVKTGEKSATIIIELNNRKVRPHLNINGVQPPWDVVIIKRTISSSSQIQIKCGGKVLSTRMDFLHALLRDMGIQINNPISVLDQNTSKTFLAQSSENVKYELFMRATALEDIKEAYQQINLKINDITRETESKKRDLETRLSGSKELIKKFEEVEALIVHRKKRSVLIGELLWSKYNEAQSRLKDTRKKLEATKKEYHEHKNRMDTANKEETYADDIALLDQQLDALTQNKLKIETEIKNLRFELTELRSSIEQEDEDFKKVKIGMAKASKFITDYNKQIENEIALGEPRERVMKQREMIRNLEGEVNALEKKMEVMESEKLKTHSNVNELENEVRHLRMVKQDSEEKKNKLDREIRSISQDGSNLSIYGHFMPALVARIDAAARTFRRKPVGPLGMHVKLLDEQWGPSVESVIGGLLTAFCVDNGEDFRKLKAIMQRVCGNSHPPPILKYKFMDRVHDCSGKAVVSPPYRNILDVLEINHPMAANVLIDKCGIESILLLPDDRTCQDMLSNQRTVPRNCYYAVTRTCDTYYPAPMYRTYAGHAHKSVRFLKASKEALIQTRRSEMAEAVTTLEHNEAALKNAVERAQVAKNKSSELDRSIQSISNKLQLASRQLRDLRNQEEPEESMVTALRNELKVREEELEELQRKLQKHVEERKKLKESENTKTAELRNLQTQLEAFKTEERKVKDEKDLIEENKAKSLQEKANSREVLAKLTNRVKELEVEIQEVSEVLDQRKREAEEFDDVQMQLARSENSACESKAKTRRKPSDVEKDVKSMDNQIAALQRRVGTDEEAVVRRYQEMKKDIAKSEQLLKKCESVKQALTLAMDTRANIYSAMMKMNRIAVDNTFRKVLRGRNYKGSLMFENSKMHINIGSAEGESRSTSTLSGGERSFGTMALLIALWYVTKLPFYFMDEFDVFMDMTNRKTIMDLMMDYTRKRNYQFCFLTPLNTSDIQDSWDVTIRRLDPPERRADAQISQ